MGIFDKIFQKEAVDSIETRAEAGDLNAQWELANTCKAEGKMADAEKWFKKLSDSGVIAGIFNYDRCLVAQINFIKCHLLETMGYSFEEKLKDEYNTLQRYDISTREKCIEILRAKFEQAEDMLLMVLEQASEDADLSMCLRLLGELYTIKDLFGDFTPKGSVYVGAYFYYLDGTTYNNQASLDLFNRVLIEDSSVQISDEDFEIWQNEDFNVYDWANDKVGG